MKSATLCGVVLMLLFATGEALGDAVWNIQLSPKSVAALQLNQPVTLTFDYKTSQTGGVRIFARPMSGGVLSPAYAAHPSELYPVGSGSGTGYFTITAGSLTVDAIRFQMFNSDQSVLLLEFYVPVKYHYSQHAIYNIVVSPETPASLQFQQDVGITFDYRTAESGGVRIFARPMSGSTLTPNYGAHGSTLYPVGSGSGTGSFTIMSGDATVDAVRFQMYNADQSALLLEFQVPVNYMYRAHSIADVQFTPSPPEGLTLNSPVDLTFTYRTTEPGGVLIFPRPMTKGVLSSGYAASGSPTYTTGSGAGSATFTITTGDVTVDAVRFRMMNTTQSQTLLECILPVNYHFSAHTLANITFTPPSPAYLTLDENDSSTASYSTGEPGGVQIWMRPITNGSHTPGYAAHGSPLYPAGSGSFSGWFHLSSGSHHVDHARFLMSNADQTSTLLVWDIPVDLHYGNMVPVGVAVPEAGVPLTFDVRQNYPNPFNPVTTIRYEVPGRVGAEGSGLEAVRLTVYDLLGRQVATLVDEQSVPGYYSVPFDGTKLSSGVYICRMNAGRFAKSIKMLLTK